MKRMGQRSALPNNHSRVTATATTRISAMCSGHSPPAPAASRATTAPMRSARAWPISGWTSVRNSASRALNAAIRNGCMAPLYEKGLKWQRNRT